MKAASVRTAATLVDYSACGCRIFLDVDKRDDLCDSHSGGTLVPLSPSKAQRLGASRRPWKFGESSTALQGSIMPASRFHSCVASSIAYLAANWGAIPLTAVAALGQAGPVCLTQWSPGMATGTGMNSYVRALVALPNGHLVAGGHFTTTGAGAASNVAEWDGSGWNALGAGITGPGSQANASAVWNGCLVVGGDFSSAGTVTARNVAKWNPATTTWDALGAGLGVPGEYVNALTVWKGNLIAGGHFTSSGGSVLNYIAAWDEPSGTWLPLSSGVNATVWALTPMANNGDLVVGGGFTQVGGQPTVGVARWDGNAWSSMGSVINNNVFALTTLSNGDVVAGGEFNAPSVGIARWDGSAWVGMLGVNGRVNQIHELPNGDWIAGGSFTTAGGAPVSRVARWSTSSGSWSALGAGMDNIVVAFASLPNGTVVAGGDFLNVDGAASPYLASLISTCPGTSIPYGVGCVGNTLVADAPPWVDATFRATGSGLPLTSLVLALTSFSSIPQGLAPLTLAFSQAVPGCDLLVAPDILTAVSAVSGLAHSELFLPNTPPLVGVTFYHQMVPIESDAQGAWVSVTATNALQLTAGMF